MASTILEKIYKYPIKGFSGIELETADLLNGDGIPNDRRYAVTRGVSPNGEWMPARSYYINALVDGMLEFNLREHDNGTIEITNPAGNSVLIDPNDSAGLQLANQGLAGFMSHAGVDEHLPQPQIIERGTKGNWDYPDTPISIINAETVRTIGAALGYEMDPLRYRGNLVVDGLSAWEEFAMMGKRIRIGEAELEVMRPIPRCPAPGVNPVDGERDIDFEKIMPEHFGHVYCGMYAVVVKAGNISQSNTVEVVGDAQMSLEKASHEAEDYRLWPRIVEVAGCETGEHSTRLSLKSTGPWPLPNAKPGQRLRFLMGADNWTSDYIAKTSPGHYHFEIEKSVTGDPATEYLRTAYATGNRMVVCGPFGRV